MRRLVASFCLLLAGVLVYWLYRPGIYLFSTFGIDNPQPLVATDGFELLIRNHFADAVWCCAAFCLASLLRDLRIPRVYFQALLALPFLSEFAQGAGLVPGTFDWADLALYGALLVLFLYWENSTMTPKGKHIVGISTVALLAAGIVGSGSAPTIEYEPGTFFVTPKEDEAFEKPSLGTTLRALNQPAVVLRVPLPPKDITEQKQVELQRMNNVLYNRIDKELARAGLVVRDRALFGKVLEQQNLDYKRIGQLTETDIIVELIDYKDQYRYKVDRYRNNAGVEQAPPSPTYVLAPAIEFKVISVRDNDLVAAYTFYYNPNCTTGCKGRYASSESKWYYNVYAPAIDSEQVFNDFATRLSNKLKRR